MSANRYCSLNILRTGLTVFIATFFSVTCAVAEDKSPEVDQCPPGQGVAVQVLGSGGPIADDGRASSAYLVWVDAVARVLIDAGSGSMLRFGEAGARFEDLELVALSHFHTDHSAALPALLKSGNFSGRERVLRISGPSESTRFPGLDGFLAALLGAERGAYRYLTGYLDGSGDLVKLESIQLDQASKQAQTVFEQEGLVVTALGVPHGIVPSVAYRVEAAGRSIVFGSDQNGSSAGFAKFALNADLLVAHLAIPESAGKAAKSLHATPSQIGIMAKQASVSKLLLSHFMARSLNSMDSNLKLIRQKYDGEITLATDLACLLP